jgi:ribosomal protein L29
MAKENTVKVKELRERPEAELQSLREAKLEEYHKAKFKHSLGQLRETHRLHQLKLDIAKLSTVLREKSASA